MFSGPGERINLIPCLRKSMEAMRVASNDLSSNGEHCWNTLPQRISPWTHSSCTLTRNGVLTEVHVIYQVDAGPMRERVFFNE